MIKGYLKNKLKEAGQRMQDQMEQQMRDSYNLHTGNHSNASKTQQNKNGPKTFDAEYKVLEDEK